MKVEEISTEVVVVGGGGAGLIAALESRKNKSEVLLITKTLLGGGSCTTLSFGAFRVSDTTGAKEQHLEQSLASGKNLNDLNLLRKLVNESLDKVRRLEGCGVPILHEPPYIYVLGKAPFYGMEMTSPLQKAVNESGVTSVGQAIVLDLLKSENTVAGLLAYCFNDDTLLIVNARSVILATGGAGALYPLHDNSPRTTGDGFAVASRAGAVLRDMEFVQFYPLGLVEGGIFRCIVPPFLGDCGPIRNALGEDILLKYGIKEQPAAIKARDSLSRAMFREILAGRGVQSCLEIDLTKLEDKDWNQNRQVRHYKEILQKKYPGLERPLKIAPVCHHFMGGVVIDEECRTSLSGLFAAGEITGGIHGANRMGGNALSECAVFGVAAGREASRYARRAGTRPPEVGVVERIRDQMMRWREGAPHAMKSPRHYKKRLSRIMFEQVGIIRNRKQLEEAKEGIELLSLESRGKMYCENSKDVMRAIELRNQIATARLVVQGALTRQESRGSHYREDYPETDDTRWKRSVLSERQ